MTVIQKMFKENFSHWDFDLPSVTECADNVGKITAGGWVIWFRYGSDGQGKFLDYYSAHRMTSDSHERLYENGTRMSLPTIQEFRVTDADQQKDAMLELQFMEENRRVETMLIEKGFRIAGNEPGGVQIQRYSKPHR